LTEKTIRLSVGSVSVDVLRKFKKDENGNYYNERLFLESEKRAKFYESRRSNGLNGGRPKKDSKPSGKPNGLASENLPEDVNVNVNKGIGVQGERGSPEFDTIHRVFVQQGGSKEMAEHFFNTHNATGWQTRNGPIKNITPLISNYIQNWHKNELNSNKSGKRNSKAPSTDALRAYVEGRTAD